MSTAQTLLLGAIAGLTIFLGLPMGRMHGVSPQLKAFFTATATGILIFLFWDVLSEAIDPVESALDAKTWGRFAGVASIALAGFVVGLMGVIGGGPTLVGTIIGHSWTSENLSILFFTLAAGSILYVVIELLNVCRTFGSKSLTAWGVTLGVVLGFATDFVLVAAGI